MAVNAVPSPNIVKPKPLSIRKAKGAIMFWAIDSPLNLTFTLSMLLVTSSMAFFSSSESVLPCLVESFKVLLKFLNPLATFLTSAVLSAVPPIALSKACNVDSVAHIGAENLSPPIS